jgi:hypothetical protein
MESAPPQHKTPGQSQDQERAARDSNLEPADYSAAGSHLRHLWNQPENGAGPCQTMPSVAGMCAEWYWMPRNAQMPSIVDHPSITLRAAAPLLDTRRSERNRSSAPFSVAQATSGLQIRWLAAFAVDGSAGRCDFAPPRRQRIDPNRSKSPFSTGVGGHARHQRIENARVRSDTVDEVSPASPARHPRIRPNRS